MSNKMKKNDDEFIGFETLLPTAVVDLLHPITATDDESVYDTHVNLDEHELAMAA